MFVPSVDSDNTVPEDVPNVNIPGLDMLKQTDSASDAMNLTPQPPAFSFSDLENVYKEYYTLNEKKHNTFNYLGNTETKVSRTPLTESQDENASEDKRENQTRDDSVHSQRSDENLHGSISVVHEEKSRDSLLEQESESSRLFPPDTSTAYDYRYVDPRETHPMYDYDVYRHGLYPSNEYNRYHDYHLRYGADYERYPERRDEYERHILERNRYYESTGRYYDDQQSRINDERFERRLSPVDLDKKIVSDYNHTTGKEDTHSSGYRDNESNRTRERSRRSRSTSHREVSRSRRSSSSSSSSSSSRSSSSSSTSSSSSSSSRSSKRSKNRYRTSKIRDSDDTSGSRSRHRNTSQSRDINRNRSREERRSHVRSPDRHKNRSRGGRLSREHSKDRYRNRSREKHTTRDRSRDRYRNRSRESRNRHRSRESRNRHRSRESRDIESRNRHQSRDNRSSRSRDTKSFDRLSKIDKTEIIDVDSLSGKKPDAFDLVSLVKKTKSQSSSVTAESAKAETTGKLETSSQSILPDNSVKPKTANPTSSQSILPDNSVKPKTANPVKKISMTLKRPGSNKTVSEKAVLDVFTVDNSDEEDENVTKGEVPGSMPHIKYNMPMPSDLDKAI